MQGSTMYSTAKQAASVLCKIPIYLLQLIFAIVLLLFVLLLWIFGRSWAAIVTTFLMPKGYHLPESKDAIFLHWENIISHTLIFMSDVPELECIQKLVLEKVVQARNSQGNIRFRKLLQTIELHYGLGFWKDVDTVDIDYHVSCYSGKSPNTEKELCKIISKIYCQKFEAGRPCWQFILIPLKGELQKTDGSVLLIKMHHAIGDGYSVSRLICEFLCDTFSCFDGKTSFTMYQDNVSKFLKLAKLLKSVLDWPLHSIKMFLLDWSNPLHGPNVTRSPNIGWLTFPLSEFKEISRGSKTRLNDVFLSCFAGSLRKYFIYKKVPLPSSMMNLNSISLHRPDSPMTFTNLVTPARSKLAIDIENPMDRLLVTKREMDQVKNSSIILLDYWFFRFVFGYIPFLPNLCRNVCTNAATTETTNIAGPPTKMTIFGQQSSKVVALHILFGKTGIGVCLVGANDVLTISFCVDKVIIKEREDLERLQEYFNQEISALKNIVCK